MFPTITFSILTAVFLGGGVLADDWPRFRGSNGSGVNSSSPCPFPLTEDNKLWEKPIPGSGHGSPVIFQDRIFLLSAVEAKTETAAGKKKGKGNPPKPYEWLALCLDCESGDIAWQKSFPQRSFKGHRFNSAASSTPAADEDQVVFAWGTPDQLTIVSLSHDGELQWEKNMGPVVGGHGFGGSPILYKDLVVLNNDQEKQNGNLFALRADSGEVAWTVERRSERISYSVPCVYEVEGIDHLVFVNWQHGFTAIDPENGAVIAEKSVFNLDTNERAISSPIVAEGLVIGTCGFTANPKHCVALKLTSGAWQEVWRVERNVPHIPSVLSVGDHTYLIDDSGIGTCLVTRTGEEVSRNRIAGIEGSIFGSPVSDGSTIYFADESGNLHAMKATPEFKTVGSYPLGELCRSTPAISDGTLYVRTESRLVAFR